MESSSVRAQTIQALTSEPLDILIIGGGIVGSGIARDAAMRGLRVGLVEQYDFAFGTSSRSSRLLHGGLRYLAQGRVWLVHEASVEKKIVHHIAPHVSAPLAFVFPTYSDNKDWKLWQLKIGVKIYDLLCGGRNLGASSWLSKTESVKQIPGLQPKNLKGAVRYYDGLTNDARLVLDTLRSAKKQGAHLINYCRYESAAFNAGKWVCNLSNELTGEKFKVTAKAIVNATGPWAGRIQHSHVQLRLTKGIHIVVDSSKVSVPDAMVMTEGKRILFVIPWGERTILGTTDTDYNGPLEKVYADSEDIAYVLKITNQHFPSARLSETDVISSWAGLRPLIADPSGKPSDISRSHEITNPEPQWWDVAGGKLTTYRLMAEQAVDQIVRKLNFKAASCRTAQEPLLPRNETDGVSSITPPEFCRSAVAHFCKNEWAIHLDDVMVRRSSWHYYHHDAAKRAEQVADWMKENLGWNEAVREAELLRYKDSVNPGLSQDKFPSNICLSQT
ncbi:MAG: glycerol-3-phosphate dehydrogenase/oxidase [Verrucomicrobia bacterium]|nr:glycerol-3-phosphate dehydrogenase/oxidase [Verrucomicrobiota bacterium]